MYEDNSYHDYLTDEDDSSDNDHLTRKELEEEFNQAWEEGFREGGGTHGFDWKGCLNWILFFIILCIFLLMLFSSG
jgi:hypothetical protein